MKEKDFLRLVLQTARDAGWMTAHFGNTVKIVKKGDGYTTIPDLGAKGFPDLVLVRGPRIMFRELKGKKGRIRPEQAIWIAALDEAGMDADFWRPDDDWHRELV